MQRRQRQRLLYQPTIARDVASDLWTAVNQSNLLQIMSGGTIIPTSVYGSHGHAALHSSASTAFQQAVGGAADMAGGMAGGGGVEGGGGGTAHVQVHHRTYMWVSDCCRQATKPLT